MPGVRSFQEQQRRQAREFVEGLGERQVAQELVALVQNGGVAREKLQDAEG